MTVFYCPHCWREVAKTAECCPVCGQPLAASDESFVDKLIAAMRHPEPTRAALAIEVLSEMLAEPRAILPLIELLDVAQDAYILRCAVLALGRFADRRAAPALSRLLLNPETPLVVRTAAVAALAQIGDAGAREALRQALTDPSVSVRKRAHRSLQDLEQTERQTAGPSVTGGRL